MSMFQKETPYKSPGPAIDGEVNIPPRSTQIIPVKVEVVEELTIPSALSIDALFAKQDALRDRFKRLKKFIVEEVPASKDKSDGLVKLDDALASLVVGITKEMK